MKTEAEKLERLQTLKELYKAAIIAGQKNSSEFPKAWYAIWEASLLNGYLQETELEGQYQISNDRLVELLNKLNWVGLIEINEPPYETLPVI